MSANLTGRCGVVNDCRKAFLASDGYKLMRYQGSPPIYVAFLAYKSFALHCQYLLDCSHQPRSFANGSSLRFCSVLVCLAVPFTQPCLVSELCYCTFCYISLSPVLLNSKSASQRVYLPTRLSLPFPPVFVLSRPLLF